MIRSLFSILQFCVVAYFLSLLHFCSFVVVVFARGAFFGSCLLGRVSRFLFLLEICCVAARF